jgi:hypothetical protein
LHYGLKLDQSLETPFRQAYLTRWTASRATADESVSLYSTTGVATVVLWTSLQQATSKLLVPAQVTQRLYINRWKKSLDLGAVWLGTKGPLHCQGRFHCTTSIWPTTLTNLVEKRRALWAVHSQRRSRRLFSTNISRGSSTYRPGITRFTTAQDLTMPTAGKGDTWWSLRSKPVCGSYGFQVVYTVSVPKQTSHVFLTTFFPIIGPQFCQFRICVDCDGCRARSETRCRSATPNFIGDVLQSVETADVSSVRAVLVIAFITSVHLDGLNQRNQMPQNWHSAHLYRTSQ